MSHTAPLADRHFTALRSCATHAVSAIEATTQPGRTWYAFWQPSSSGSQLARLRADSVAALAERGLVTFGAARHTSDTSTRPVLVTVAGHAMLSALSRPATAPAARRHPSSRPLHLAYAQRRAA